MTAIRVLRLPRGLAGDIVLAAVVFLLTVATSALAAQPQDRALWPGGVALIAVVSAALALRRRHPPAVLAVATLVTPLYYPLGFPDGPIALVFLVALFTTAVESRLWVALGAVIVINAGFVVVGAVRGSARTWNPSAFVDAEGVAGLSVMLLGTVAAGHYVRTRRALLAAAELRAAEAERDREQEARRRAVEERLRIARELHDVLAHQISLINVQAGAALHRRDDPERAYASLEAIKQASKQTLRELRGVLGVLRQVDEPHDAGGGAGGPDAAGEGGGTGGPVEPAPSLERLEELLDRARAAGLPVRRTGGLTDAALGGLLAPPAALAGYRIVQEALTNAVRHAGAAAVTVAIRFTGDDGGEGAVIVQIDDDGTGAADPAADPAALERGNGLRGMRERAAAVGGTLTAGPSPGGGFRVRARLPVAGDGAGERVRRAGRAEENT
ncbi:sensor histidine kinase [Actinomadura sp. 9N407]|uniref:sensor histidine kinase n=1 Tax=Actinomadura sp. 9N407 TaxID=3375154 RepID=UPI0037A10414